MSIERLQQEIEQDKITLAKEFHDIMQTQEQMLCRIDRQTRYLEDREKEIAEKQERLDSDIIQEQLHNKAIEG